LQVSANPDFSTTIYDQSGIIRTYYTLGELEHDTTYYWRVNATNAVGTGDWSNVWRFTTILAAPATPAQISPANGETKLATNLTLVWRSSPGAASYRFQLSPVPDFSTALVDTSNIIDTTYTLSGVANGTTYYWRIGAINEGGTSAWSTPWAFTTVFIPPESPILVEPADGATGVSINPTLIWNPSDGADAYQLQVATRSDFSMTIIDTSDITNASLKINNLSNDSTYYWRVNASNEGGAGEWSDVFSFTTNPTSVKQISSEMPNEFKLSQCYPNPFNSETSIQYQLPKTSEVKLGIYNLAGQLIATLTEGQQPAGLYSVSWNGKDRSGRSVASGVYLYKLETKEFVRTRKLILIR